jgi:hypothetical protein
MGPAFFDFGKTGHLRAPEITACNQPLQYDRMSFDEKCSTDVLHISLISCVLLNPAVSDCQTIGRASEGRVWPLAGARVPQVAAAVRLQNGVHVPGLLAERAYRLGLLV